jgi:hypothetical protein
MHGSRGVLFALDRSVEAQRHLAEAQREAVNMGMAPLVTAAERLIASPAPTL